MAAGPLRRLLISTGVYPPDPGGVATHLHHLLASLDAQRWIARVVINTDGPARCGRVTAVPRSWPWPQRGAAAVAALTSTARASDVIYAGGLHPHAVLAARLTGTPLVVRIVGDSAWERARRLGISDASFEEFQQRCGGHPAEWAMRAARTVVVAAADAVVVPTPWLAEVVRGWATPRRLEVIPNGVRIPEDLPPRTPPAEGRLRAVYVGRLIAQALELCRSAAREEFFDPVHYHNLARLHPSALVESERQSVEGPIARCAWVEAMGRIGIPRGRFYVR